jgi:hypothetical protein
MFTSFEIGQAGERIVAEWLHYRGYTRIKVDTRLPGSTDIDAQHVPLMNSLFPQLFVNQKNKARMFIQVKSAVYPNNPESLSSDEKRNITSRATKMGARAWEARVRLNSNLKLIGEIRWRELGVNKEKGRTKGLTEAFT